MLCLFLHALFIFLAERCTFIYLNVHGLNISCSFYGFHCSSCNAFGRCEFAENEAEEVFVMSLYLPIRDSTLLYYYTMVAGLPYNSCWLLIRFALQTNAETTFLLQQR